MLKYYLKTNLNLNSNSNKLPLKFNGRFPFVPGLKMLGGGVQCAHETPGYQQYVPLSVKQATVSQQCRQMRSTTEYFYLVVPYFTPVPEYNKVKYVYFTIFHNNKSI